MKTWENQSIFKNEWENVVYAYLNKYPNKFNKSVHSVDILNLWTDKENCINMIRLITVDIPMPRILSAIFGLDNPYKALEYIKIDRDKRNLFYVSNNISFNSVCKAKEIINYSAYNVNNEQCTLMKHNFKLKTFDVPFKEYAESFMYDTVINNASKGVQTMEYKLKEIEFNNYLDKIFYNRFHSYFGQFNVKNKNSYSIYNKSMTNMVEHSIEFHLLDYIKNSNFYTAMDEYTQEIKVEVVEFISKTGEKLSKITDEIEKTLF